MTDEQFNIFMEAIKAQTEAIQNLNASLSAQVEALNKLKDVSLLGTALGLCKTRSTENVPLQEEGGLAGAIEDIGKFLESGKTPENWKDSVTNEIYIKTFSGKPLKVDEI
ncbi:MAG: hypothetical protein J5791_00675 [Fibrobacter sp.]|nr:hypothetical protein [Fibrobacter sp.]